MKNTFLRLLVIALFMLFVASCGEGEKDNSSADDPLAIGEKKVYSATGNIVFIEIEKKRVQIRHDDIEGFMMSMTMWFAVKDEKVLQKLKGFLRGDRVSFELVKIGLSPSYIRSIEKIKK